MSMHWLRTAPLADELRAGTLTEAEKLRYLVGTFLVAGPFPRFGWIYGLTHAYRAVPTLLVIALTVGGPWLCYRANARGDGARLIERLACLGFPVGVRVVAIAVAVRYGCAMIGRRLPNPLPFLAFYARAFPWFSVLLGVLMYFWLYRAVLRASGAVPVERPA